MILIALLGIGFFATGVFNLGDNEVAPFLIIEGMILFNIAVLSYKGKNINRL